MDVVGYAPLYEVMQDTPLAPWADVLPGQIQQAFGNRPHGDLPKWREVVKALVPPFPAGECILDAPCVGVPPVGAGDGQRAHIEQALRRLHPWRKGPYCLQGVHIDTEWRSDWKWNRLQAHIEPLTGRRVLDVGCGNGYHCWRMAGEGARLVIGVDPGQLYVMQYWAVRQFMPGPPVYVVPLTGEQVPGLAAFDTVFSMGVLYHRRRPLEHLRVLHTHLRPGGELVLETLVIEGGQGDLLKPAGRYARMRNVWSIPSPPTLVAWIEAAGFCDVQLRDVTVTTPREQRRTDWMRFHSLPEFLDPDDPTRTVEGYPAPIRAICTAKKSLSVS